MAQLREKDAELATLRNQVQGSQDPAHMTNGTSDKHRKTVKIMPCHFFVGVCLYQSFFCYILVVSLKKKTHFQHLCSEMLKFLNLADYFVELFYLAT